MILPFRDPEKQRKWAKKYYKKNRQRKRRQSKEYYEKNKPRVLKSQMKYQQSPKGKASHSKANSKYRKTKKFRRKYLINRKKPEVRAYRRVQSQTYNRKPEVIEYRKEYRQRPKVKVKRKATMKA